MGFFLFCSLVCCVLAISLGIVAVGSGALAGRGERERYLIRNILSLSSYAR